MQPRNGVKSFVSRRYFRDKYIHEKYAHTRSIYTEAIDVADTRDSNGELKRSNVEYDDIEGLEASSATSIEQTPIIHLEERQTNNLEQAPLSINAKTDPEDTNTSLDEKKDTHRRDINNHNTDVFFSRLYFGHVMHQRYGTPSHRFRYKVFFGLFNLDELEHGVINRSQTPCSKSLFCRMFSAKNGAHFSRHALEKIDKHSRLFAVNRWGALSLNYKDHGAKDGSALKPWIIKKLREGGYDFALGPVMLQCFPRVFGFMFNPISIWYCYDTDENLRVVLYEVRNTFREWRGYMLPAPEPARAGEQIRHSCAKTFYVSPLIEMGCVYHFTLRAPDNLISVQIRETRNGEDLLFAAQTGRAHDLKSGTILRALARHPFLYLKIILGIHKEALVTLIKGAKFFTNPRGVTGDVTYPEKPRILSRHARLSRNERLSGNEVLCDEKSGAGRNKAQNLGE